MNKCGVSARLLAGVLLAAFAWDWWAVVRLPADVQLADGSRLQWQACEFELDWPRVAHCGRMRVTADSGREHSMPVVVLKQRRWLRPWQSDSGPLLYIHGGPGSAGGLNEVAVMDYWFAELDALALSGDLVLYDQRGTGLSLPSIQCAALREYFTQTLNTPLTAEQAANDIYALEQACAQRLRSQLDFADYNTRTAATDALRLMQLLGGDDWNVYAVSYGSRVALELMRTPDLPLRSVILDSVYPGDKNGFLESYAALSNSVLQLDSDCDADSYCTQQYGDFLQNIKQLMLRLGEQPLSMQAENWASQQSVAVVLDQLNFIQLLITALSDWQSMTLLPSAVAAANRGEVNDALQRLMDSYITSALDRQFSPALFMLVECNDTTPVDARGYRAALAPYDWLFPGSQALFEANNSCPFWRAEGVQPLSATSVDSALPSLVLSGRHDPLTPAAWGRQVARTLAQGYYFELDGVGHSVIGSDDCGMELARQFLHNPAVKPTVSCDLDYPPKFE